jgi:protein-tyrosine phosphatase
MLAQTTLIHETFHMADRVATRICFVCLGNICRSPTAEGVMRGLAQKRGVRVDVRSAGTAAYHVGEKPDHRARKVALQKGYQLESVAQHFTQALFARFDLVVAMDRSNLRALERLAAADDERKKLRLLRDYDKGSPKGSDVPDPYYGEMSDFEHVVELCERACTAMLDAIAEGRG